MVRPRADGTGFFTTEKPERTYETERGAEQAERMFQHPELWQGWVKEKLPLEDILDINSTHCFTALSHSAQKDIREKGSDGWVMDELLTSSHGFYNGDMFHTVNYILDFSFEDAHSLFSSDFHITSDFPSVDDYKEELETLAEGYINS